MSKTAIIIYGNIASGKTTVCRLLGELHPEMRHISLDKCRMDVYDEGLGNGPGHRDMIAQRRCLDAIETATQARTPLIFETTAVTQFWEKAKHKLLSNNYALRYVHLYLPVAKCLARYNARLRSGHIQAPFAWGKWTIEESMYYFAARQTDVYADLKLDTRRVRAVDAAKLISEFVIDPALRS